MGGKMIPYREAAGYFRGLVRATKEGLLGILTQQLTVRLRIVGPLNNGERAGELVFDETEVAEFAGELRAGRSAIEQVGRYTPPVSLTDVEGREYLSRAEVVQQLNPERRELGHNRGVADRQVKKCLDEEGLIPVRVHFVGQTQRLYFEKVEIDALRRTYKAVPYGSSMQLQPTDST